MDRFQQLRIFTTVAEEEGFAAAARRLRTSPPAVTRAVAALEERLGVRLLDRSTRHVRVTEAGRRYLEDGRRILADMAAADEAAAGIHGEPRGHLRVTAPALFGRLFVLPGILEYLGRYPAMTVEALFLDRVVNLLEEGLDVGIRVGELPDSSLRALKVGTVRRLLVAAPAYLEAWGMPGTPEDLSGHCIIASSAGSFGDAWRFHGNGSGREVALRPRLTVTTNDAAIAAARAGFGITRVLSYQVAAALTEGHLRVVLPEFESPPQPIHIVHREGRHAAARVRTFIDLLSARLRPESFLA